MRSRKEVVALVADTEAMFHETVMNSSDGGEIKFNSEYTNLW